MRISTAGDISYFTCCGSVPFQITRVRGVLLATRLGPLPSLSSSPGALPIPHHLALSGVELSHSGPSCSLNSSVPLEGATIKNLLGPWYAPKMGELAFQPCIFPTMPTCFC